MLWGGTAISNHWGVHIKEGLHPGKIQKTKNQLMKEICILKVGDSAERFHCL
jgi:hypothetical protein